MPAHKERKAEEPYQSWVILYPTQKGDLEILKELLLPKRELSLAAVSVFNYLVKPPKGKNARYVVAFWLRLHTLTKISQTAYPHFTLEASEI